MATMKADADVLGILKQCTVKDGAVFLPPGQLERRLYTRVAAQLTGIGGKWDRKTEGFLFALSDDMIDDLLAEQQLGANRNLKKKFQFFPTPDDVADQMMALLPDYTAEELAALTILEPSAGDGSLIRALRRRFHTRFETLPVDYLELLITNREAMKAIPDTNNVADWVGTDNFLNTSFDQYYHLIIANPPFTNNQDIDHIRHMWYALAPGGVLLTLASTSWSTGSQKKQKEFRAWLQELGAEITDFERGSFSESGTQVPVKCIFIRKPDTAATLTNQEAYEQDIAYRVYVNEIIADPKQPRKEFPAAELAELAQSIELHGLIHPITVRPNKEAGSGFILVAGERRWRATQLLNKTNIKAFIRDYTPEEVEEIQLVENLHRSDIHPMREALAYLGMLKRMPVPEIAARMNKTEAHVGGRLRLNSLLPPLQELFLVDTISLKQAMQLARATSIIQEEVLDANKNRIEAAVAGLTIELDQLAAFIARAELSLDNAPFNTEDATLNVHMGACTGCRFNTNVSSLFQEEKTNRCQKPSCFAVKHKNAFTNRIADAVKMEVRFLSRMSYQYGLNEQYATWLQELGQTLYPPNRYTIVAEPVFPTYEQFNEAYDRHWNEDGETYSDEELKGFEQMVEDDYKNLCAQYQADMARYEGYVTAGTLTGMFISVDDEALRFTTVDIMIVDGKGSGGTSTVETTELGLIESRAERKETLQQEKQWSDVRTLVSGDFRKMKPEDFIYPSYKPTLKEKSLTKHELVAACMALFSKTIQPMSTELSTFFGTQGGDYDLQRNGILQMLQKLGEVKLLNIQNYLLRRFIIDSLPPNGSHLNDELQAAGYQFITEHLPEEVGKIEVTYKVDRDRRQGRLAKRLEQLNKPPKEAGDTIVAAGDDEGQEDTQESAN